MNESDKRDISVAAAMLDAGRPADALARIAPVLASSPDDVELLLLAARASTALTKSAEAIDFAERAIALDPKRAHALRILAYANMSANRLADARAAARGALELEPDSYASHLTRARMDALGREPSLQGLHSARTAVELGPDEPEGHLALAAILAMDDDTVGAQEHYRIALRLDPQNEVAKSNLAAERYNRRDRAGAAGAFADALASDPQSTVALFNLRISLGPTLRTLWLLLLITTAVGLLGSLIGVGSHIEGIGGKLPWILGAASVAALAGLVIGFALLRRAIGRRFSRIAGGVLRADPWLGPILLGQAVGFVVGAAGIFVPADLRIWTYVAAIVILGVAKAFESERSRALARERSTLR